jgi:hypothetical protein
MRRNLNLYVHKLHFSSRFYQTDLDMLTSMLTGVNFVKPIFTRKWYSSSQREARASPERETLQKEPREVFSVAIASISQATRLSITRV